MGEPPAPEDRPEQTGDPSKPWNKSDFIDFLNRQNPDQGQETDETSLDRLDYRLQEKIMNEFEIFSALSEEIEERALTAKDKLHGPQLRLLSSFIQIEAELSQDVVNDAAKFRNNSISGEQLLERYHQVAVIYTFIHRHLMALTDSVG